MVWEGHGFSRATKGKKMWALNPMREPTASSIVTGLPLFSDRISGHLYIEERIA